MNIFFLSLFPRENAKKYHYRHCIKIILEIAQMLYNAHPENAPYELKPYRKTHRNHPMSVWVRQTRANYRYACALGLELCYEYTRRFEKIHKTQAHLEWLSHNIPEDLNGVYTTKPFLSMKDNPEGCTAVPQCMPEEYQRESLLDAYNEYYKYKLSVLK